MFLRQIAIACLPVAFIACCGCHAEAQTQPKVQTPVTKAATSTPVKKLTAADNGKTVTVTTGTQIVVELDGNMTTGFSWDVSSIQGTVTQKGTVKYGSQPLPPNSPPILGAPGVFTATFESGPAGTSTVNMEYKRPFEHNKPPAKTFKVKIVVTP